MGVLFHFVKNLLHHCTEVRGVIRFIVVMKSSISFGPAGEDELPAKLGYFSVE